MPRRLRPEEEALWRRVTMQATPIRPLRPEPRPETPLARFAPPPPMPEQPINPFRIGEPARPLDRQQLPVRRDSLRIDRRTHKELSRGKRTPEATIDLHGMTLAQAHPALTRFILASSTIGRRLVLVITGKGKGGETGWHGSRGVLRRQVPEWLAGAPLGSVVQEVLPAHRSHGGSGAYYVILRRG